MFLLLLIHLSLSFGLEPPDCPLKEGVPCIGHSDTVRADGATVIEILDNLYNRFCGCQYVEGNIDITFPPNLPDINDVSLVEGNLSFFYHIREISGYVYIQGVPTLNRLSLPNLRIIRGETQFDDQYSLVVFSDIGTLYLPNLTEITKGGYILKGLSDTSLLCNVRSIDWDDIFSEDDPAIMLAEPGCSNDSRPNCTAIGCSNCWCDDSADDCCQTLTADCGCDNRCFRSSGLIQCCNAQCSAGCTGGNDFQCLACKNVNNNGTCSDSCPARRIFDQSTNSFVSNPDFKFQAGNLCVSQCPDDQFELEDRCVLQCPVDYQIVDSETGGQKCEKCDGICPQECPGGTTIDPSVFEGCTIIQGSLRVTNPVDPSVLSVLNTIQEIRGSLTIERFEHTEFPYLSNLVTVGSDFNETFSFSCNNSENRKYSILIDGTDLISIDLSSLQEVNGGGVQMSDNPDLCYVGDLSYYVTDSSADLCLINQYRSSNEQCSDDGFVCHPQCIAEHGCWGPNDTQCVTCINFLYNGQCVPSCENFTALGVHLYSNSTTRTCELCDPFCNGSCVGKGPAQCNRCLTDLFVRVNEGTGIQCLNETCITDTYIDTNITTDSKMECLSCFSGCTAGFGCGGPLTILNSTNGCIDCNTIILKRNGEQDYCQRDPTCPSRYYQLEDDQDLHVFPSDITLCSPCHELCATCSGAGVERCESCMFVRAANGSCAYRCDNGTELNNQTNNQVCISTKAVAAESNIAAIAGGVSAVLIFTLVITILLVFVLICIPRFRRSKIIDSRYNSIYGEMEMHTLEKETLQPPKVPPNAARLIVAPEDALEFGKELGAGAFGTVYEGYWKPENDTNQYHVAIKVLKNTSAQANKELLQEGVVMASMDHENVVRLYCVCMSQQLMLVSQFVPLGALLDYLKKHKDRLNALIMLQFSSQIAKGMAYLETCHLVHRDLAARNVLVQSFRRVKITDFGLTRILESEQEHYKASSTKMPVRWLPPESIRQRIFTHKTDVWGFGVTVWEILTFGARPYQGKRPFEILKQLEAGHRLEQPVTCTLDLYALLLECWLLTPDSRPDFDDLHNRLDNMLSDPGRYILTVQDGNASDYGQLPSNIPREGDTAYEQPFTGEVTLSGTLSSKVDSITPYAEVKSDVDDGYDMPLEPRHMPTLPNDVEKKLPSSYEIPLASPPPSANGDPRYVKMHIGDSLRYSKAIAPNTPENHGYDYIDEQKLQLGNKTSEGNLDDYTLMSNVPITDNAVLSESSPQSTTTGDNYELFANVEYEPPKDGQMKRNKPQRIEVEDHYDIQNVPNGLGNLLHDPNSPYEVPMDGQPNNGLTNLMYDSRMLPNAVNPNISDDNYEFPEDPDTLGQQIPQVNTFKQQQMSSPPAGGIMNVTYDSRAGTKQSSTIPAINDYETIDDDVPLPVDGFVNVMYDSKAGTMKDVTIPTGNDYESVDDDVPLPVDGFVNVMYDSKAGTMKDATIPPGNDYETIDDDVPLPVRGFSNVMYDLGLKNDLTISDYECIDDDPARQDGIASPYEVPVKEGDYELPHDPARQDGIVSPYEVPVKEGDYELPHDGDPNINVYDAPHS